jgi:hypothetical protein
MPLQSYMLLADAARPTSNTIFQDWHSQIVNRKLSPLRTTLRFTYPYQNIISVLVTIDGVWIRE